MTIERRSALLGGAFVAICCWLGASCASTGMDRGAEIRLPEGAAPVTDNAEIERELGRRPQLPEHVRLGVYFRPPPRDDGDARAKWRWTMEDRTKVVAAGEDLPSVELFPLSDTVVDGTTVEALRLAAARHGADALLVVDGGYEQASSTNGWAVSYALLVPVLFAPGGELETVFRANAAMYDVRNGYLYMTAESETEDRQERAHLWIDEEEGVRASKTEAIDELSEEIGRRLAHMLGEEARGRARSAREGSAGVPPP
jgi:hypothetical protein